MTLIVEGERITDVKKGYLAPTEDTVAIDLKSKTVYPGFIDMHVHIEGESNPPVI